MGDDAAQRRDRGFELLQRRRIVLADDQVDLLRQRAHGVLESDQAFGRRQPLERIAHFAKTALESGQSRRIDASGRARVIDPLRQRLDFDLQRFHRMPRQRFGELAADLGEILAEA